MKYSKKEVDAMVEAAKLEVEKWRLINSVDPNKYCDNCKYCPCACHLIQISSKP